MLWKLSLTGIKSRLRDYIVLFSGLVMASAIFYMFQSMAANEAFLKSNSILSVIVVVFYIGSFLLALITLVYILYANSFLMAMRQKDYAMFMMLGARSSKIGQMIFIETFAVGIIATAVGSAIGVGLTTLVNYLLTNRLGITVSHFSPFNQKALLITGVFFTLLFLIASLSNARRIAKKPILSLLRANQTPVHAKRKRALLFLEAVGGLLCLAVGYYLMANIKVFQLIGFAAAVLVIVLGTYFVFHAVLIFVIQLLKHSNRFALKKLNNFTLAQLDFRIQDYTRMLSMVSILFALALGALTVGLGFRNEIPKWAAMSSAYDLVLNNAQEVDQKKVAALRPTYDVSYQQKEDAQTVYYVKEQFDEHPLKSRLFTGTSNAKAVQYRGSDLLSSTEAQMSLKRMELPEQQKKTQKFVSAAEFVALPGATANLEVVQVKDFMKQRGALKALAESNTKNNPSLAEDPSGDFKQKAVAYDIYNGMFSGFEFMGFFLGIAFLAMLASCLMFKILSGANSDEIRYAMLAKIGARKALLSGSLRKEIGVLFLVPGILGMVHVLFGLKMFSILMMNPYDRIWLPFLIFLVLYFIYYLLTIWIYQSIVLRKKVQ
ncbi:FtsX-like permease family protein [Enterococcus hirae]|nr:FtsX-like permease family protein [Enterococcus hirae]